MVATLAIAELAASFVEAVSSLALLAEISVPLMIKSPLPSAALTPVELIPEASEAPSLSVVSSAIETSMV